MSVPRLYLLRHGETAWNRDGNRYAGRTDVPLSDVGREQARQVAAALATIPFAAIYASPLRRSRETAEVIAATYGLPVITEPRLVEIDFGRWEGKTRAEIERDEAATWTTWRADPDTAPAGGTGETGRQATDRVAAFVYELSARQNELAVLAVGHNTLNRLFLADVLGMPLRNYPRLVQDNAGVNVLELGEDGLLVRRLNVSCRGL